MATNFEKLQKLLEELFQLDRADLDFGIYRIMNQRRDEIVRFLREDLLPQVKEAFKEYRSSDKADMEEELRKAIDQAKSLGVDPETTGKVKELRRQIADTGVDVAALENEVFSHLYNFFRRYYHEGDFISLRRYKEGVYAIPYEGEEVKLHWANHDQYYIKSSEYFRDYVFTMPSGKRVRVHLVAASSEQDNKKEAPGKERRFIICKEDPIYEKDGELFIRFEYRADDGKKKQDALNQEAIARVLKAEGFDEWARELSKPAPTTATPKRTVLEKHLTQYTARNTFDYFIHKDLGGFLRRELDFYIKNEVMHLDDIEHETVPRVEQYLSKIKVIRKIAQKIIQFLEQLENFQKKLWVKKKFVLETNYCITLDRVPEGLYPEIAANNAQREEWVRLFAIDKIEKDLAGPGYSKPLSIEFLKAHPSLLIDTQWFHPDFVCRLLSFTELASQLHNSSLLIQSDNFHALKLLGQRFRQRVNSIYIDPPYNTTATEILYKNDYKHSSWLSFILSRLDIAKSLLSNDGIICVTIDDVEFSRLGFLLEQLFGADNHLGTIAIRNNPQGRSTLKGVRVTHEYASFFAKTEEVSQVGRLERSDEKKARWDQTDEIGRPYLWENFRKTGTDSRRSDRPKQYYPLYHNANAERLWVPAMDWDSKSEVWIVREDCPQDGTVFWPVDSSGQERVWKWGHERVLEHPDYLTVSTPQGGEPQVYCRNYMNEEGKLPSTWWDDARYAAGSHGTNLLTNFFGRRVFDFPKSVYAVEDCLRVSNLPGGEGIVLDFFGGSGTTAHAVINLNRSGGNRRYIVVEVGDHFDEVLLPRIKKSVYATEWDDGKPLRADPCSHSFKYIRLESYDDALNNLELKRTSQQTSLLDQDDDLREQYVLSYMLDVESRGSQSLLNVESFRNPDQYKLRVERNGGTQLVNVDLIETFNWLLGLTVKHIDVIRGMRVVEGTNPAGERVLVLWRNLDEIGNDALDEWFRKQGYNTKDQEYDLLYVNGDNNLENLRRSDQTWKVRLTEEEFGRLMFDVQDV